MAIFAKVENGIVVDINVADQAYIDGLQDKHLWIETRVDGSIRKNYATIGCPYNAEKDAFIPPEMFPSWVLNEQTFQWQAPTPYPTDGYDYYWDEANRAWVALTEHQQIIKDIFNGA